MHKIFPHVRLRSFRLDLLPKIRGIGTYIINKEILFSISYIHSLSMTLSESFFKSLPFFLLKNRQRKKPNAEALLLFPVGNGRVLAEV